MDPVKDSGPKRQPQQNQRPIVPFLRGDRILLIGEGELIVYSIACSILSLLLFLLENLDILIRIHVHSSMNTMQME